MEHNLDREPICVESPCLSRTSGRHGRLSSSPSTTRMVPRQVDCVITAIHRAHRKRQDYFNMAKLPYKPLLLLLLFMPMALVAAGEPNPTTPSSWSSSSSPSRQQKTSSAAGSSTSSSGPATTDWAAGSGAIPRRTVPCKFNPLCSCEESFPDNGVRGNASVVKEIHCKNVPLFVMPSLPTGDLDHVDVVQAPMKVIEDGFPFHGARVKSLRLAYNELAVIRGKPFRNISPGLEFLDLSNNELDAVPSEALRDMRLLGFLSLSRNRIISISSTDFVGLEENLKTLKLSENLLTDIPDGTFRKLSRLKRLHLDGNRLTTLPLSSLPTSTEELFVDKNFLRQLPQGFLDDLPRLMTVSIERNDLTSWPCEVVETSCYLDHCLNILNLNWNRISSLAQCGLYNGSLSVRDIRLAGNQITYLPAKAFQGTKVQKLHLSFNKITAADAAAFVGVEETLLDIDLSENFLGDVPAALGRLKKLRSLLLSANSITGFPAGVLHLEAENTLRILDLERNRLQEIPGYAWHNFTRLTQLSLGYNQIRELNPSDFEGYGSSLRILLLRSNRLSSIPSRAFQYTPNLTDLAISFNPVSFLAFDAFIDLGNSLKHLEMSYCLYREKFPTEALASLRSLTWLAADNNHFATISSHALETFKSLEYISLQSNRLAELPRDLFRPNIHQNLREVRLSNNMLSEINPDTFRNLDKLKTVTLAWNKISTLRTRSFNDLKNLTILSLAGNKLNFLLARSLTRLPKLEKLYLQHNKLRELQFDFLYDVGSAENPLMLNMSFNSIRRASCLIPEQQQQVFRLTDDFTSPGLSGSTTWNVNVSTLDLSYNLLTFVPFKCLSLCQATLKVLDLSENKIVRVDKKSFSSLRNLQSLSLKGNKIQQLHNSAFGGLISLQVLDLSENKINYLPIDVFKSLFRLRSLDLSRNSITEVPVPAFQNTVLEFLDLSVNRLASVPKQSLEPVSATLKHLDMSRNSIDRVDTSSFVSVPSLVSLNLANNRLNILPDNTFQYIPGLRFLDIGGNRLRANYKELLHYVGGLKRLSLSGCYMDVFPTIPLAELTHLNVSHNYLTSISPTAPRLLTKLQSLTLEKNQLSSLQAEVWRRLPALTILDISHNPFTIFDRTNFVGLAKLDHLTLRGVPFTDTIEGSPFALLERLTSIVLDTFPQVNRGGDLRNVLAPLAPQLRRLDIRVLEPVLFNQLQNVLGHQLDVLAISGRSLGRIAPKAISSIYGYKNLVVRITGTSVKTFPDAFLSGLRVAKVMTLDLSRNSITKLPPQFIYGNSSADWESIGTKNLEGGLIMDDNPIQCTCRMTWLGQWMRRWLRESVQIHRQVLPTATEVDEQIRTAVCIDPRTKRKTSLVDFGLEEINCNMQALASGAGTTKLWAPLWGLALGISIMALTNDLFS